MCRVWRKGLYQLRPVHKDSRIWRSSLLQGKRNLLGHERAALDGVQQHLGAFLRPGRHGDDHLQRIKTLSDHCAHIEHHIC